MISRNVRKSLGVFAVAAFVIVATGCTSEVGSNFDLSKADHFKPGVTTYDQAVAQLGKPISIRKYPDGRTGAAWQYIKGTTFSGGSGKGVGIVFDSNGVMERMSGRTEIGKPE